MPTVATLSNGLRVITTHMPHATSVSVSVYLAAGSRYEADTDAGLSHFVEHLCFKGTERRPRPQDVAIEIDAIGGTINAATEREYTVYYAKVTREHAERAVDILADVLQHSLYLEPEIERERGVILEELAAVEDSPDEQAALQLDAMLWPRHPLGRDIAGTPATVKGISVERLRAYASQQYVANAAVVSIAGALTEDEARRLVEDSFGQWQPGTTADWKRATDLVVEQRSGVLAKPTEQAHLSLGMRGLSLEDPDRYAADTLSVVLGEGMSSRLFLRLREELGLCYDIHTFASHLRDTGMFGIYAGVDPDNAREAVREVVAELRRIRDGVDADELERAKGQLRSRVLLRMEDSRAVSGWYGAQAILGLPSLTPDEVIERSAAVTAEDVCRVAGRLFQDEALRLSVVGPFEGVDLLEGVSLDG
ncbi:MAG: pitrilysin family protein [Dehalococcoidia bacterium]